jgi:hypothetical protein
MLLMTQAPPKFPAWLSHADNIKREYQIGTRATKQTLGLSPKGNLQCEPNAPEVVGEDGGTEPALFYLDSIPDLSAAVKTNFTLKARKCLDILLFSTPDSPLEKEK